MRKVLIPALAMAIFSTASMAFGTPITSMEQRFRQCDSAKGCSLKEALDLLVEMNKSSSSQLEDISAYCKEVDYTACIGYQKDKIDQWQRVNAQATALMKKVEAGEFNTPPAIAGAKP